MWYTKCRPIITPMCVENWSLVRVLHVQLSGSAVCLCAAIGEHRRMFLQ